MPPVTESGACHVRGRDKGWVEGPCGAGTEKAVVGEGVVTAGEQRLGDVSIDDRDFFQRAGGTECTEGRGEGLERPLERGVGGAADSRT